MAVVVVVLCNCNLSCDAGRLLCHIASVRSVYQFRRSEKPPPQLIVTIVVGAGKKKSNNCATSLNKHIHSGHPPMVAVIDIHAFDYRRRLLSLCVLHATTGESTHFHANVSLLSISTCGNRAPSSICLPMKHTHKFAAVGSEIHSILCRIVAAENHVIFAGPKSHGVVFCVCVLYVFCAIFCCCFTAAGIVYFFASSNLPSIQYTIYVPVYAQYLAAQMQHKHGTQHETNAQRLLDVFPYVQIS